MIPFYVAIATSEIISNEKQAKPNMTRTKIFEKGSWPVDA